MKKYTALLIVLVMCLFLSGGCGGGGDDSPLPEPDSEQTETSLPEPDSEQTETSLFEPDADGDGVPDVFGYTSDISNGSRNYAGYDVTYEVPYLNYISPSMTDSDDAFRVSVWLQEGQGYTLKYSHSGRTLDGATLNIDITTPEGRNLILCYVSSIDETPGDQMPRVELIIGSPDIVSLDAVSPDEVPESQERTYAEPVIVEPVIVSTVLDVVPEEAPCAIFKTFIAPQTGTYEFVLTEQAISNDETVPYEFRIEQYDGKDTRILAGTDIELNPRETVDLQRVCLSYASGFNDEGLPTEFREGFAESYSSVLGGIAENSALRASAFGDSYMTIASVVHGVPYAEEFTEGRGFYAHTGDMALNKTAFSECELPYPEDGNFLPVRTITEAKYINTEEELKRELHLDAEV